MNLLALSAFTDNYIWMLHDGQQAIVIDPGQSAPVLHTLHALGLVLAGILVTHDDHDHIDGIDALRPVLNGSVWGPILDKIPTPYSPLKHGDAVELMGLRFEVLGVPGHTAGHIAYFHSPAQAAPLLFCGDALFSGGCGYWRVGTPEVAHGSLNRLAQLPDNTQVCCAHEYTLANLLFARAVEPSNIELQTYALQCEALRAQHQPTLPSTIGQEKRINPFVRCHQPEVVQAALAHGAKSTSPADVFAALRTWKNTFR
jgi:hydroxyacylglutathione hydrolase